MTKGEFKGLIRQKPGTMPKPLPWTGEALPRPEDYVLAKSGKTIGELRAAAHGPGTGIEAWTG